MTRACGWIQRYLRCFLLLGWLGFGAGLLAGAPAGPPVGKTPANGLVTIQGDDRGPGGQRDRPGTPKTAPRPSETKPQRQVVQMVLKGQEDTGPKLGYGNCQWLYPLETAPEKLLQEPKCQSNKPVYYGARYGDAEDNLFTLVLDERGGPGKGYDVLYADVDNDNRIDPDKERFKVHLSTRSRDDPLRMHLLVTAGGVRAPYYVNFTAFPYSDDKYLVEKIHANLRNSSYYEGQADLLGSRRRIAIADLNSNGRFNDVEPRLFDGDRFFVDLDGESGGKRGQIESFPYGGYTRIAGTWHSIVAAPDGSRVEITRARPPLGKVQSPPRVCAARLSSPSQPLDLKFTGGADVAVAGEYSVRWVELRAADERPDGRTLSGSFLGRETKLTVREGQTVRLEAGLPLKVQPQVAVDEERTLRISLRISGAGGETYRWSPRRGSTSKAGFEILDASGKAIASDEFEYG